jgi:L-ascorbate metabolism protein UlaG (beta-lactamase superfamily)
MTPDTPAAHFDGRRFRNPNGANGQPFWRVPSLLLTKWTPWPARVAVEQRRPLPLERGTDAVVTFIGHATFLIQSAAGNVLTDPVYAERASPLRFAGPRRVRPPGVAFADLPPVSVVVLSHNHYDHCDLSTLRALDRRFGPLFLVPLNNGRLLRSAGLARVEELDWWQEAKGAPMGIAMAPAQHFSSRGAFDRNRALWGSYVVAAGGRRIYFAGDTGYGPHFGELRERLGAPDLALLPIGAYEPRWFMKEIHMDPDEAVRAHLDLGAARSLGMHFGTFQLTPEGISAPLTALEQAREARQVPADRFRNLDFGESLRL